MSVISCNYAVLLLIHFSTIANNYKYDFFKNVPCETICILSFITIDNFLRKSYPHKIEV